MTDDQQPTQEESAEQRLDRLRGEVQREHTYRIFTEPQDEDGAVYGFHCKCGAGCDDDDPLYSTAERRDEAVREHVERACDRAVARGYV